MKILMVFIDMFRVNLTNTYNANMPVSRFDTAIKKLGGTLYTNCYTPAPDTPRSNGCLWSSSYPVINGCDNRLKYPMHYLKEKEFLEILKDNNYSFNFYISPSMRELGELPKSIQDVGCFSNGLLLKDYLETISIKDNSLTYLGFNDYHQIISDCFAQKKYVPNALEISGKIIDSIDHLLGFDSFDLTIIYSDHGFKELEENFSTPLLMLSDARTQILMLARKKNDKELVLNSKLSSIMDIYPTVLDACGISYQKERIFGISLFSEQCHSRILIEDHSRFSVELGQTIEQWGIKSERGLVTVNTSLEWSATYDLSEQLKDEYYLFLETYGTNFIDNIKMKELQNRYKHFLVACPQHFDGTKRKIHKPVSLYIRDGYLRICKMVNSIARGIMYRRNLK